MKIKNLVAMAVGALLAASFSYAMPSTQLVDDMNGSQQSVADNGANVGSLTNSPVGATNDGSGLSPDQMSADNSSTNSNNLAANGMSPNANDDISADTATGDDDY